MTANIPMGAEVASALRRQGGRASAKAVCDELVRSGFERAKVQLAIQRAVGRQIAVNDDWTLSLNEEAKRIGE